MRSKLLRAMADEDRRREREEKREQRRRRGQRQPDPGDSAPEDELEELVEEDMILDVPYGGAGGTWGCIPEAR